MKTVKYKLRQKDYDDLREGRPFVAVPIDFNEQKDEPYVQEIEVSYKEERRKVITESELIKIIEKAYKEGFGHRSGGSNANATLRNAEEYISDEFFGEE